MKVANNIYYLERFLAIPRLGVLLLFLGSALCSFSVEAQSLTDQQLIDLINQQPPVPSNQLKNTLLNNSPLSDAVLLAMLNRTPPLPNGAVKDVLLANSPLSDVVLLAMLNLTPPLPNGVVKDVLLANSPLSDAVLIAMINSGLSNGPTKEILLNESPLSNAVLTAMLNRNPPLPSGIINQIIATNPLTSSIITTNVSCNGGNDGSIDLTATGGGPPHTFLWSTGATTEDINNLTAGTYSVTITDQLSNTSTANATITEPSALALSTSQINVSCNGGNDGSIDLTSAGGTSPYNFSWSNGANTEDIGSLISDTYEVTVTDNNGCTATTSTIINEPPAIVITPVITTISCNGLSDGSIDISVSNGVSPYSFTWSNGAITEDLSGLSAGTFEVIITDVNGCTATTVVIIDEPAPLNITTSQTDVTCNGANDGSVDLTVTGGTTPYDFSWSNGEITEDLSGLSAGTFEVIITDANGCSATTVVIIDEPAPLNITTSQTDVTCNGANDGSVDLTVTGGTTPYDFNWSNGAITEDLSGLSAGTFDVIVTDNNGCTITLANQTGCLPPPSNMVSWWPGDGNSNDIQNGNDGTLQNGATFATGLVGQAFSLDGVDDVVSTANNPFSTAQIGSSGSLDAWVNFNSLPPLNDGAFVADIEGWVGIIYGKGDVDNAEKLKCRLHDGTTKTVNTITPQLNQWYHMAVTWDGSTMKCYLDGVLEGSIAAGAIAPDNTNRPFSIGGASAFLTGEFSQPLALDGLVDEVEVYDRVLSQQEIQSIYSAGSAGKCKNNSSIIINEPQAINLTTNINNISCNGANNGSIDLTVANGTTPYSYSWSNGATTEDISNLTADTYIVTVTDNNGCTATLSVTVIEPDILTLSTSITDESCNGSQDGAIDLTVTGGTPPYNYIWSNGVTTQNLTGLVSGTYQVTVTDGNGCIGSTTVTITQLIAPTIDGLSLINTGGFFRVLTNTTVKVYGNVINRTNGLYDNQGEINLTKDLINNGNNQGFVETYGKVELFGQNDQAIIGNNITTFHDLILSGSGIKNLEIGAEVHGSLNLNDRELATYFNTDLTIKNTSPGAITRTSGFVSSKQAGKLIRETNANNPYLFPVGSSVGTTRYRPVEITPSVTTLESYSTRFVNNNPSVDGFDVNAKDPSVVVINPIYFHLINRELGSNPVDISLFFDNQADGSFNGVTHWQNVPQWEDVGPTVSILNTSPQLSSNAISGFDNFSLQAFALSINSSSTITGCTLSVANNNISICEGENIQLNVSGQGITDFLWTPGVGLNCNDCPNPIASPQSTTTYTVSGFVSGVACAQTVQVTVNVIPEPEIFLCDDQTICFGASAQLFATGGATYTWSPTDGLSDPNISNPVASPQETTTYNVIVTAANGCSSSSGSVTVNVISPVTIEATRDDACPGRCDGIATAITTGQTPPFSYLWSNGATTASIDDLCGGDTYSVTVTNGNGCTTSDNIIVGFELLVCPIDPCDGVSIEIAGSNATCIGACDGSIDITITSGVTPYTFLWDDPNASTTEDVANLCPGQYTVSFNDADGCFQTAGFRIEEEAGDLFSSLFSRNACISSCDAAVNLEVTGGIPPYDFLWDNGASTEDITGLCAGQYNVIITDFNGCQIFDNVTIIEDAAACIPGCNLSGFLSKEDANCPDVCDGSVDITIFGGTTPYSYNWSNGAIVEDPDNLCEGNHSVTVTDANGCAIYGGVSIGVEMAECTGTCLDFTFTTETEDATCPGVCDGTAELFVTGAFGPIEYQWSNGNVFSDASDLCAGIYTVTITDVIGRVTVTDVTIGNKNIQCTNPCNTLSATIVGIDAICPDPTAYGEADLTVFGGNYPYTYEWSNDSTTQDVDSLIPQQTYTVTVTDAQGCVTTSSVTTGYENSTCNFTDPCQNLLVSIVGANESCSGFCDGSIDLTVTGGTTPYCFLWYHGQVIEDNAQCQNLDLQILTPIGQNPFCILWTQAETTEDINGLCAGPYRVEILDATGCQQSASMSIGTETFNSIIVAIDADCPGTCDGSANLSVIGGSPPYLYQWSNGANTQDINFVCDNSYSVIVTDANGCTLSDNATIGLQNTQCPDPCVGFALTLNGTDAVCPTACDGSVFQIITNGTAPFTYTWSNGASTQHLQDLCTGQYDVTTTDASNCTATTSVTIGFTSSICPECQNFNASVTNTTDAICQTICNGSIDITVSGGSQPYIYNWSSGATTKDADDLCPGNYSVTITDQLNCELNLTATINATNITCPPNCELLETSVTITDALTTNDPSCPTFCDGEIELIVTGGLEPYTYQWSDPSSQTDTTATGLCPGTYTVTATDANTCTIIADATVSTSDDCDEEYLSGISLNNYGAYVKVPLNAGLNVYGHVYNEIGDDGAGGLFVNSGAIRVTKYWVNNGGNDAFDASEDGLVELIGNRQWILGTDPTQFYELSLFNPQTKKLLAVNAKVDGFLHLNDCEFATRDNLLIVNTENENAVDRTSAIDDNVTAGFVSSAETGAYIRHTGAISDYPFHVGSSIGNTPRYRPVVIKPTVSTHHEYGLRMVNFDPEIDGFFRSDPYKEPNIEVINNEFYHLIDQISGVDAADITISYHENTDNELFQSISHWDDPEIWTNTGNIFLNQSSSPIQLSSVRAEDWNDFTEPPFALSRAGFFVNTSGFGDTDGDGDFDDVSYVITGDGLPPNDGTGADGPLDQSGQGDQDGTGGDLNVPNEVGGSYTLSVQEGPCNTALDINFEMDNSGNMSNVTVTTTDEDVFELADDLWFTSGYTIGFNSAPADDGPQCDNLIQVQLNTNDPVILKTTDDDLFIVNGLDPNDNTYQLLNITRNEDGTVVHSVTGTDVINDLWDGDKGISSVIPGLYKFELTVGIKGTGGVYTGDTHLFEGQFFVE